MININSIGPNKRYCLYWDIHRYWLIIHNGIVLSLNCIMIYYWLCIIDLLSIKQKWIVQSLSLSTQNHCSIVGLLFLSLHYCLYSLIFWFVHSLFVAFIILFDPIIERYCIHHSLIHYFTSIRNY